MKNIFDKKIYNKNVSIGIINNELYKILVDINLWSNDIKIKDTCISRQKQQIFRDLIVKRDIRCIITKKFFAKECQACHIISVKENGSYDIDNGLLINSIHHKSFDNNLWCINPYTLCVDILINDEIIVGSIFQYNDTTVNIKPNNIMLHYLKKRWNNYIQHKTDYNKQQL
jgi:hypothetical protein